VQTRPEARGLNVNARKARLILVALGAALLVPGAASAATPDPNPNGRVVFASTRYPATNQELYSVNPDGTGLARLTWSPTGEQHPSWSPDGSRIAFESSAEGASSIHVIIADGADDRRVSPETYNSIDTEPTWSPDGSQIAFASTRPFNDSWHIWVMNADGSGLRQLTNEFSTGPAWSPDGSRIAYLGSGAGISVVNTDGSDTRRVTITPSGYSDDRPSWSPDSSQLVFPRRVTFGNDSQLYVIDADGSDERQLTTTEGASRFPSWSPDGAQIVFTHIGRLSVIGYDGSGMRPLIGEPWGDDLMPNWGTSTIVPDPQAPGAPTILIFSPAAQLYPAGYPLEAFYLCESETSFVVSCEGDVPLGSRVDTTAGRHTFTVRAADAEGRTSTASVSYDVIDFLAPEVVTRAPGNGSEYEVGQSVEVDYECLDEPGGSGILICDGELDDGQPLDTSRAGTFTVQFWAVDNANNVGEKTVTYTVVDRTPPTVSVSTPQEGAAYVLGESVVASYSCGEDAVSCVASQIDTSSVGAKTFTVTAKDASHNATTVSRNYRVVYPFSDLSVASGATAGEKLPIRFSLGADRGLSVVVSSVWRGCGAVGGDSSPAVARLSYQADRYKLQVETDASWAGSCRRLEFTLDDGTTNFADVSFN
jgi:dipeptidyl aminopeptidase/acylaminoacyl peptidase